MVDPAKIETVKNWPIPQNDSELRGFLGLSGYYQRFVPNYSALAKDLTDLLKKDVPFKWDIGQTLAFEALKERLMTAPVLSTPIYADPENPADKQTPFEITTDASNYAIGAVISQEGHPIAYHSRKLSPAEQNYAVHEKELLAVVDAVREWHHYIEGQPFIVYTDHKSLEHFMKQPAISRRQANWLELLQSHDFNIVYIQGKSNAAADGLSRKANLMAISQIQPDPHWLTKIRNTTPDPDLKDCTIKDGVLYKQGRIYIPDDPSVKLKILKECHDSLLAGHFGYDKTLKR